MRIRPQMLRNGKDSRKIPDDEAPIWISDENGKVKYRKVKKKGKHGKLMEVSMFRIDGGPHYDLETSVDSKSIFLRDIKNNRLIGILQKNGQGYELAVKEAEKMHFLDKLSLVPKVPIRAEALKDEFNGS